MNPMLPMLSPFFIEGTAQMCKMMPDTGARAFLFSVISVFQPLRSL
jgi:hypothetical protein